MVSIAMLVIAVKGEDCPDYMVVCQLSTLSKYCNKR